MPEVTVRSEANNQNNDGQIFRAKATLRFFWLGCTRDGSADIVYSSHDAFFFRFSFHLHFRRYPVCRRTPRNLVRMYLRTFCSSRGEVLFWSHSQDVVSVLFSFGLCLPAFPSYSNTQKHSTGPVPECEPAKFDEHRRAVRRRDKNKAIDSVRDEK